MDFGTIKKKLSLEEPVWLAVLCIIVIKSYFLLTQIYDIGLGGLNTLNYDFHHLAPPILLLSFAILLNRKHKYIYLLSADIIISILYFVDLVYDRAFGHLINIYMICATSVFDGLNQSAALLVRWTDFFMFVDLPVLFILLSRILKTKPRKEVSAKRRLVIFLLTAGISFLSMHAQFRQFQQAHYSSNVDDYPLQMSPLGDFMFNICIFYEEKTFKLDQQDKDFLKNWFKDNEKYQQADHKYAALQGILKNKNIIAIHFESLENFVIGKSFYNQEITPNMNKMLKNSIYFSNVHEQTKDGNSSDCELMFNNSIYPLSSGAAAIRYGHNSYLSLPKLLKKQNYTSIMIHGDDKEFWNRYVVYPTLGYDKFIDEEQFTDKASVGLGILDKSLFTQTITEAKKLKEPYFISDITITSHCPFIIDDKDKTLDLKEVNDSTNYLQAIHYTDATIGGFLEDMKANGMLENTAIVIYGDHEGLHKYCTTDLPDNNKEIPFIIYIPGFEGVEMDKIGGQVDMLPTLTYLMGIDAKEYAGSFMGRNLFSPYEGTAILSNGDILGNADDKKHLQEAQEVSDKYIMGFNQMDRVNP